MTEHHSSLLSAFNLPLRQGPCTVRRIGTLLALMILPGALLHVSPGHCHGVDGHVKAARGGYQVTAVYDDGEPMSYAAVEILSPGEQIAFQKGRTDRNGIMMFLPDRPGPWQAIVSDGMGHRLAMDVEVTGAPANDAGGTQAAPVPSRNDKPRNIITGLAVIFGLFGGLYGWRGRRAGAGDKLH